MQCCTTDGGNVLYQQLPAQAKLYHLSILGNGNLESPSDANTMSNMRSTGIASGYRMTLTGGNVASTITPGSPFAINLSWQNIGLAPVYEKWTVMYELRNSANAAVWSGTSSFNLRLFLPQSTATTTIDNFTVPSTVTTGTYKLVLIIRDPNGYRTPFPLAINGRNTDGSYTLANVTVGSSSGTNVPPVANAGTNQTITLPTNTATLSGSGTDADGTISAFSWSMVSGPSANTIQTPNTAVASLTGLVAGTYSYRLTVTDNGGATGTADVSVTVNPPPNQPPFASAGNAISVTLPANTATLTGQASDADGTVVSTVWTKVSGPAGGTLTTPNSTSTTITGLTAGSYLYKLTVTDNSGAATSATVTVTVNSAPIINQPPTVSAGSNITMTLPVNSTNLTGSASDPDGTISSYGWTQTSGPSNATIAAPSSTSTAISGLVQGSYVFSLTVTDNSGATAFANVTVTVNPAPVVNVLPTVSAGNNLTVTLPTNSATLSGTASDPDGTIASYAWTKVSGPTGGGISKPTTASTGITGLTAGSYVYKLTVTDNSGGISSATVTVTVNSAPIINQPPTVSAGNNITLTLPVDTTILLGSASDADGIITSTAWSQASGPSNALISSPSNDTTVVTGLVAGSYVFSLTVTDNSGATVFSSVTVSVNPAPAINVPPTVSAGSDFQVNLPINTATLTGTASDSDGSIVSYAWNKVSGPSGGAISRSTAVSTGISGLVAGTYVYKLTVTDNSGAIASATVTIKVNAIPVPNQPPTVTAGSNINLTLPLNSTTLMGSANDPDGTITAIAWSQVSGPSNATVSTPTNDTTTVSGLVAGTYIFKLSITDNSGAISSASATVTVNPAPVVNIPPTVSAGSDFSVTLPTNSAALTGTASDVDGTLTAYAWTKLSGPSGGRISTPSSVSTSITGLLVGTYVYKLTVTDNSGAKSSANVTVTVLAAVIPNKSPVVSAGNDITIVLPTDTTKLTGTATDADGSIVSYAWSYVSGPSGSVIVDTASTSTTVSGLVAGTYIFQLAVTDNSGATSTSSVTVTVNPAPVVNIPPTVSAGSDFSVTLPINSAALTGTASDVDGSITAYAWTKLSGPTGGRISTPSSVSTSITGLLVGTYVYKLTVTDNSGAKSSATITVTVNSTPVPNQLPIVSAGNSVSITSPDNSVTLVGTASDPDGKISSLAWSQTSGGSTATFSRVDSLVTTVSGLLQGIYVFRLTATDNSGASVFAEVTITVNPPVVNPGINQSPVANAGTDQSVTLPVNNAILNGSGSSDPDGTIQSYQWNMVSGPGSYVFSDSTAANPAITGLVEGTYEFQLTITDNTGATSSDKVIIKVLRINQSAIVKVTDTLNVFLPVQNAMLDASSSYDPDGTITSYKWTFVEGPQSPLILNADSSRTMISNLIAGIYTFNITVMDNSNAVSTSVVTVMVNNSNTRLDLPAFQVYPNPARSSTTLRLDSDLTGKALIQVVDMNGRPVISQTFMKVAGAQTQSIDLSKLQTGMYFMTVQVDGAKKMVKKIMKL
jgi:ribosomal protein L14